MAWGLSLSTWSFRLQSGKEKSPVSTVMKAVLFSLACTSSPNSAQELVPHVPQTWGPEPSIPGSVHEPMGLQNVLCVYVYLRRGGSFITCILERGPEMLCRGRTAVFRSLSTITFLLPPFLAFSYSSTFPDVTLTLRSVVLELLPLLASFQCLLLFELTLCQSDWSHGLLKSCLSF